MKSLFIRKRRCSGTVVVNRFSALIFGAGKSKVWRYVSSLYRADFSIQRAALEGWCQILGRSAYGIVQVAGDAEHGVAKLLGVKPAGG
jgi:hypothetical protein